MKRWLRSYDWEPPLHEWVWCGIRQSRIKQPVLSRDEAVRLAGTVPENWREPVSPAVKALAEKMEVINEDDLRELFKERMGRRHKPKWADPMY